MMVPRGAIDCAMHMTDGLVSPPNNFNKILDIWEDGCVELFEELSKYAIMADTIFRESFDNEEWGAPGVYDYEVSYEFGWWFGDYISKVGGAPEVEEATAYLKELDADFWKQAEDFMRVNPC